MKNQPDFKNIRVLPTGFQVAILRQRVEHSKHFPGHSLESYMEAITHRNQLLRKLPKRVFRGPTARPA